MDIYYSRIKETLRAVWKEVLWVHSLEGLALLGAVALALLLTALFLAEELSFLSYGREAYLSLSLIALGYVFYRYVLLPLLPLWSEDRLALFVEGRVPGLKDSLINSLQLGRDLSNPQRVGLYSHELITLLFRDTASRLEGLRLREVVERQGLWKKSKAFGAAALLFTILIGLYPGYFSDRYNLLLNPQATPVGDITPPVIGDITLTYRFPVYTRLDPRTVIGSPGDIKGLKGSEVEMTARSDRPLASASLIINDASKVPVQLEGPNTLKVKLVLLEGGSYRFETTAQKGLVPLKSDPHTITIEEDEYPDVWILSPKDNTVVNERDVVRLDYGAQDDFGLKEIRLVVEGRPGNKNLKGFGEPAQGVGPIREYRDSVNWNLAELKLSPGEKLAYYLEAVDNDVVSGPKVARSKTQYLEVYSSEKRHSELLSLQDTLLKEMVQLLAEELVNPPRQLTSSDELLLKQEALRQRMLNLLSLFDRLLPGLEEDALANYAVYYSLENIRSRLSELSQKKTDRLQSAVKGRSIMSKTILEEIQGLQDSEIAELERDILFLVELLRKQRLDDFLHVNRRLEDSQWTLTRLLDDLKKGAGAELEDKVRKAAQELEDMINSMMDKLSKMSGQWGDEFLNLEAIKSLGEFEIDKDMEEMRDALAKGDLQGALQAALRAMGSLGKMMAQMGQNAQQYADSTYSKTLKEMHHLEEQLGELEDGEKQLAQDTEELKKDVQSRTFQKMDQALGEFFQKQLDRLHGMEKELSELEKLFKEDPTLKDYSSKEKEVSKLLKKRNELMRSPFSFGAPGEQGFSNEEMMELSKKMGELNRARSRDPLLDTYGAMSKNLPELKDKLSQLGEMLEGEDFHESLEMAKDALRDLGYWDAQVDMSSLGRSPSGEAKELKEGATDRLSGAKGLNEEMVKDLESLASAFEEMKKKGLTQEDKEKFQQMAKRQGKLEEDAQGLGQALDKLSQENPSMGSEPGEKLGEARDFMGKAEEKLGEEDGPGAMVEERESLYRLSQAKKGLSEAVERVAKGMMSTGIPMPRYVMRYREAFGEEGRGFSTGEVEIPSEEAYRVPKEFRQDILDAMKQGLPEKYQELNKDYYRKLVE